MSARICMKWIHWLTLLLAACVVLRPVQALEQSHPDRPNIVFILADDLGWTDLACYGSDLYETPHLDQLAQEGMRFTQAYAMSVCSPTRAAILTGKHAARLRFTIWREGTYKPAGKRRLIEGETIHDLAHSEISLAEQLKARGYLCFHVGKWHLGDGDHSPETHGFDVNIGGTHWGAPTTFFHPFSGAGRFGPEFRYVPGLGLGRPGDYLTDRLTDEAIKLIDEAGKRPFFLNLWYHNPHTPIEGKPALVQRFRDKIKADLVHKNPDYAAMVYALDENVGRVLRHLEDRGLAKNTLLIFVSDNGGYIGIDRKSGQTVQVTSNAPLRSGKGSLYEGGIRVPLIVRYPGVVPDATVCNQPVTCMDFLPTLLEATGASPILDPGLRKASASPLDGISFYSLLHNPKSSLARRGLFFHYPHYYPTTSPVSALRDGPWKLIEYFEDNHLELYRLDTDPGETVNLAPQMPEKAAALHAQLRRWRKSVGASLPTPNPSYVRKSSD
jgi:arylsulfatase A